MFDISIMYRYIDSFVDGFAITASISIASILGSFCVGLLIMFACISHSKALSRIGYTYINTFRNIPFIVQVFFIFYGLPELKIFIDPYTTGVVALSIAVGAYCADVLRASVQQVDKDVIEAAQSFGLSRSTIYRKIVLPIALRNSIKPLGSIFVNLILTTSILSTVTLNELTGAAKIIAAETFRPFEVYFFLLLFYCVLTYILSVLITLIHKRLNRFSEAGA
ncbi:amino acid ABC transporter permease [Vibrio maerlii]|uniref:amino acid ABC transporter permease n=1 Tax=Vibrio maerlii TaxID=2231648 RepID=UPI001F14474E|nr:amino acid ABC transporter permease [Vibrio maerlii]